MSDNFWDNVEANTEQEPTAPAITPQESETVFPIPPVAEAPPSSFQFERRQKRYNAKLSDFDVSKWDSENDAQELVDWFNQEYTKQGGGEKTVQFFMEAGDISNFDSKSDAKTILALALGILNGNIEVDQNGNLNGWEPGYNPQWMKEYEAGATMWAGIGAASVFTLLTIFVLVSGTILAMSMLDEKEGEDWPTGEAQIVYFDEWVETSCDGEGGCSDTQYAEATFRMHCTQSAEALLWTCGGNATTDTTAFFHTYESGFFEHAPVAYIIEKAAGEETITIAYNPNNPGDVDLRPGFQMNWEWLLPVLIPCAVLLVIARNPNVSVKEGFVSIKALLRGELEV